MPPAVCVFAGPVGFTEHSADADIKTCDLASYKTSISAFPHNVKQILGKVSKNALQVPRFH